MAFSGSLALEGDARPLRADLELTATELVVTAGGSPVGSWSLTQTRIEPSGGRFLLTIGEEEAWFTPDEPVPFARAVLDRWGAPSLSSAVQAVRAAVGGGEAEPAPAPDGDVDAVGVTRAALSNLTDRQRRQIAGVGMLVMLALIALLMARGTETATTPVLGTVASTTAVPSIPLVFTGGLEQVPALWNEAAAELGLDYFVASAASDRRLQVGLPEDLVLYATTDPATGLVRTLMVSAGPGQGEHGQLVLAMWGNLIAMVNPELGPEERRGLLEKLGVDIAAPLAIGLNNEAVEGGARYWLRSGVIGGRVWLNVAPAA
jgi:hypothetical protein